MTTQSKNSGDFITLMRARLNSALAPSFLEIDDEGAEHAGHGAAGGHFAVTIAAPTFAGKSSVECHRLVYQALGELVGKEVHALRIKVKKG